MSRWGFVLAAICFALSVSGCKAIRKWRAAGDANSAERMKSIEKQVDVLTERLEQVEFELRFNVATNQVSLGKFEEAVKGFREVVNRNPNSTYAADSLYEIAKIYKYHLKKQANAVATYEELIRRYPRSQFIRTAAYAIAESLAELGKKTEARDQFRKIVTQFGRDPIVEKAYFELGDMYQEEKRWLDAKNSYQKLIDLFPAGALRPAALYRLANCSLALGDTAASLRLFAGVYTEFPAGDFAELAYFDRISILVAQAADSDARAGINDYLVRYPTGRFRAEVERVFNKLDRKKPSSP